jgi:hypothetical protein
MRSERLEWPPSFPDSASKDPEDAAGAAAGPAPAGDSGAAAEKGRFTINRSGNGTGSAAVRTEQRASMAANGRIHMEFAKVIAQIRRHKRLISPWKPCSPWRTWRYRHVGLAGG